MSKNKLDETEVNGKTFIKANDSWRDSRQAPPGWNAFSGVNRELTNDTSDDYFILISDGVNDVIVWYEHVGDKFIPSIVESVPTEMHIKYAVKPELLVLKSEKDYFFYGDPDGRVISSYFWESARGLFVRYIEQ